MEITSAEFVRRVCATKLEDAEPVSGAVVMGPVRLTDCIITNGDWSDCVFDSSVTLRDCTLVHARQMETRAVNEPAVMRYLDLSRSRVAGGVSVEGVVFADNRPAPPKQTSFRGVGAEPSRMINIELCLEAMLIEGDLRLARWSLDKAIASSKLVLSVSIDAKRSRVSGDILVDCFKEPGSSFDCTRVVGGGGLAVRGRFGSIEAPNASFASNVVIELAPRLPVLSDMGSEGATREWVEGPRVDLYQARVGGDVVLTSHHETSEPYSQAYDEGIAIHPDDELEATRGRIIVGVMAAKASVERDFIIGRERSDYTGNDCQLELVEADLSSIRVGGNVLIARAEISSFFSVEENKHENLGIRLRGGRAESVQIDEITVCMEAATTLPAGEILTVLDLMELRVQREIEVVGVKGKSAMELPLSASAICLRQAECATLVLDGIELSGGDSVDKVLGINAIGIVVSDEARIGKSTPEGRDPFVDLSEATLGCLSLSEPPPEGSLHLRGTRVGRWGMAAKSDIGDQESFETYRRLLKCADTLDVAQYVAVERRLAEIGKTRDADQMHVYWKRKERSRLTGYRRFASLLHHAFLGYGTQVWRPALMLAVMFVVSLGAVSANHEAWLQVSNSKQAELAACGERCLARWDHYRMAVDWPGRVGDAFAVTARSLVPIVDLQLAGHLEPIPRTGGAAWVSLMRLLGYLLWPIFLTGLLAQLLPQARSAR